MQAAKDPVNSCIGMHGENVHLGSLELAYGGKIVLLVCQEGKKLSWGFFENGPVRLAGVPFIQFQARENAVREGNFNMEIEGLFI